MVQWNRPTQLVPIGDEGDPVISLECAGPDFYFVFHPKDGSASLIIAKRARPGTLHYPAWHVVEPGWQLTETPDGKIVIRRPDGQVTQH